MQQRGSLKHVKTPKKQTDAQPRAQVHDLSIDQFVDACRLYVGANLYSGGNLTVFLNNHKKIGWYALFQTCYPAVEGGQFVCCDTTYSCQNEKQYQSFNTHCKDVHFAQNLNKVKDEKDPEARKTLVEREVSKICPTHGGAVEVFDIYDEKQAAAFREKAPPNARAAKK